MFANNAIMNNVSPGPRYQVFLSSTYEDLRVERQQATQAVLEMGHFPAGMELFPASDQTQADLIRRVISESDYYVLILAGRYGSTDASGLSYTEMEYDWAIDLGLPILAFVRRSIDEIAVKWTEKEPEKRAKLEAFREKVMKRHVRMFDTSAELGMQVMKSLMNESRINPRIGWIRSDQIPNRLDVEIEARLRDEIKIANKKIKTLERNIRDGRRKIPELSSLELASGADLFCVNVMFTNQLKQQVIKDVYLTWDQIFSTIAPSMYGYIQRRFASGYKQHDTYQFESDLINIIRITIIDEVGSRNIRLFPHQIDTILIQFQQLGYIAFVEREPDGESSEIFRGYTLTEDGESYLMKIKLSVK